MFSKFNTLVYLVCHVMCITRNFDTDVLFVLLVNFDTDVLLVNFNTGVFCVIFSNFNTSIMCASTLVFRVYY